MAFRIRVVFIIRHPLNREPVYLISVALQIEEPQNGQSSRSGYVMQQVSQLSLVKSLNIGPEPMDLYIFGAAVFVQS